jgi:ribosomal protein S18 acetylase RimI-like enzyme
VVSVSPPFAVRSAGVEDIAQCVELALLTVDGPTEEDWQASLSLDLVQPERRLVVAALGERIVGYGRARLFEPGPEAPIDTAPRGYYLVGLIVRAELRRRGIGLALTQDRLDWIRGRAAEAWFFANARNSASIELHRRLGFAEAARSFSYPGVTFSGGEGILFHVSLGPRLRTRGAGRADHEKGGPAAGAAFFTEGS